MNRKLTIIMILLGILLISGCSSSEITVKDLIPTNVDNIDEIQVSMMGQESFKTLDKEVIGEIVNSISKTNVNKLSVEEDIAQMKNDTIKYSLIFSSDENISGMVMIFTSGNIVFADTDTMRDQRTVTYRGKLEDDTLDKMANIFEKL